MHNLLLVLLLLIVGRIVEQIIFLGVCWKLMNVVDSELDLELYPEDQERGWIGLCMKGWRRLTEVVQVGLVVLVALWKVQVRRFKAFFFILPFFLLKISCFIYHRNVEPAERLRRMVQ